MARQRRLPQSGMTEEKPKRPISQNGDLIPKSVRITTPMAHAITAMRSQRVTRSM
jgi:hypothetical protein